MKLKKNVFRSLVLPFVVFFIFSSCRPEHPSPIIVNVNVVNENYEELNNCTFSATLDGKQISDLRYDLEDWSTHTYPECVVYDSETQKLSGTTRSVKSAYSLYSHEFSEIIGEMEAFTRDNMADLFSRIKITVDCSGYESIVFSPILNESSYYVAEDISVQLKKK